MTDIAGDIAKLRRTIEVCGSAKKKYRRAIRDKLYEQKELMALLEDPGQYSVERLQANIDACDRHVALFEASIGKEQAKIKQLEQVIAVLEERVRQQTAAEILEDAFGNQR